MIQKFLQGGLQNQQIEQLFVALDQQPQEVVQELIKNGVNPEDIIKLTEVGVQQKKIKPESAQIIQSTLQQIVKSAKHGAKLNYIKLLNHKCADDEELYYFKKGGRVGCGCKKKMEDGGQLKDKSWKAKFKAKQAKAARANNAVDKNCSGAKIKLHKLGGSLNGIHFMQQGGEINPYDARYPLSERLRASTNDGTNRIYNFFKRIFTSRPAPEYLARMEAALNNSARQFDTQQRKAAQQKLNPHNFTPANALLTVELFPNGSLGTPSPKQEKSTVTKDKSQTKPKLIKGKSQTSFGGVQKGWRNTGQFESVIDSLTPLLLMWLDLQGISTENALTLQQGINKYLKSIGDNRSIPEDNYWGTLSQSALNEILQNVPSNVSLLNIPKENSIELYPTRREGLEAGFFKKGGNLNGIPFYQAGTNKGGIKNKAY